MTRTPTEIADSLLPCPFPHLGKELLHGSWPAKHQFWIHCPCGAMGPHADSPEKAIAAWNRRATSRDHRAAAEEIMRDVMGALNMRFAEKQVDACAAILSRRFPRTEISRALGGAVGDGHAEGYAAAREDAAKALRNCLAEARAEKPGKTGNITADQILDAIMIGIDEFGAMALERITAVAPPSAMKPQGGEE